MFGESAAVLFLVAALKICVFRTQVERIVNEDEHNQSLILFSVCHLPLRTSQLLFFCDHSLLLSSNGVFQPAADGCDLYEQKPP